MQLHNLQFKDHRADRKRIGRGGKRGFSSGRGTKGQKARAGTRIRPGFRGGDNPLWKLFPKQRGANKKIDVKHRSFQMRYTKPAVVNLNAINRAFKDGERVEPRTLLQRGLIITRKNGVKILSEGTLQKKLNFSDVLTSATAAKKITAAGGTIAVHE